MQNKKKTIAVNINKTINKINVFGNKKSMFAPALAFFLFKVNNKVILKALVNKKNQLTPSFMYSVNRPTVKNLKQWVAQANTKTTRLTRRIISISKAGFIFCFLAKY